MTPIRSADEPDMGGLAADRAVSSGQGPRVTIGVPVYNGEEFLTESLESLLGQTFGDFELIISDNASTDGTSAICRGFAEADKRVRYVLQSTNIGAPANWNTLVHLARGEYFQWASASDLCAPTMLAQCARALDEDDSLALCYGLTQFIDDRGARQEIYQRDESVAEPRPSDRFWHVCRRFWLNNAQSGLFRISMLRRTRLDRGYPAGDLALMAEAALYGRFKLISDVLLFRRRSERTFNALKSEVDQAQVLNPAARRPARFVKSRRHIDNMISIARSPIGLAEQIRAAGYALRFAAWDRQLLLRELFAMRAPG